MSKVVIYIIAFFFPYIVFSQNYVANNGYDYPIKPGTKEWKSIEIRADRVDACQIPKDILEKLSTDELLETCLNYPFIIDVFAYNDIQAGFLKLLSEFNGLQELINRQDFSLVVFKEYASMNPEDIVELKTENAQSAFLFRLIYLEVLLAQDVVVNKTSEQDARNLLSECVSKYEIKQSSNEYYGMLSFTMLTQMTNKVLLKAKYGKDPSKMQSDEINRLSGMQLNPDSVYVEAKEFLNNKQY